MSKVYEILQDLDYGVAPEASGPATEWLEAHGRRFGHFIGGDWREAETTFASFNPATGAEIAQVGQGSPDDVDRAVAAARAAFPEWSALPGSQRARYLYAIARQVQKHARLFAVLETMDNGKPIRETRDLDVPLVARHFYHHAGWATLAEREFPGYEPVGVCGQIIPWNFPLLMLAWKIAPALAMGNTVVLKPAEFTSLTALLFAEICERVGLPPGVVNILTGDGETGKAMVAHPGVDKIAFTGSTEVGKIIRRATAGTPKKLSLELGGKSPYVVYAPVRACSSKSQSPRTCTTRSAGAWTTSASETPSTRQPTSARSSTTFNYGASLNWWRLECGKVPVNTNRPAVSRRAGGSIRRRC
jgi:aldehyde dehydrogenase (NAD+)